MKPLSYLIQLKNKMKPLSYLIQLTNGRMSVKRWIDKVY